MFYEKVSLICFVAVFTVKLTDGVYIRNRNFDCGPYGFTCENSIKLRLCEGSSLFGPSFICPANTICNEDSSDVCENAINYIDPSLGRSVRCRQNERIADPNVPGCKGYILCIPNKNRFQGIKFKCAGSTIFNGVTRTCSAPDRYKCPLSNTTRAHDDTDFYGDSNRRIDEVDEGFDEIDAVHKPRPIDCKHYKFSVTQEGGPARATYFCPSRPVPGETSTRCTVFSNQFCVTLKRDDRDQFTESSRTAYRRPRLFYV